MKSKHYLLLAILLLFISHFPSKSMGGEEYSILVVMSYEEPESNPWSREIKEGIDGIFEDIADISYFYMNTKIDYEGGGLRAKEAFELYKRYTYDGVITVDDNAQSLFAVPYLKGADTPVMFCGVNADPAKYGYPASNISGILERGHYRESIAFFKQLVPETKKIGFIVKDSPSGRALKEQIDKEKSTYLMDIEGFELVSSLDDLKANKSLYSYDAFFIDSVEGILDENKLPLKTKEVIAYLTKTYKIPIVGANTSHVMHGALCAVVKTGQEQGAGAAQKLLEALRGTPISKIPISKNYKGKRVINVSVMNELGIKPKPISLLGVELLTTQ